MMVRESSPNAAKAVSRKEGLIKEGEKDTVDYRLNLIPSPIHTSSGDKRFEMSLQSKQDLSLPFQDS